MIRDHLKRVCDIVFALMMIVLFGPLLLLIAASIWWIDGAPIMFGHMRIGRDGRRFQCLKFRTMIQNSQLALDQLLASDPAARLQWERSFKLDNDPRILPGIGALLRKTSLDELPQLFNVLRGDMSLVGPRPIIEDELVKYGDFADHYMSVRPGLTGPWQIGGRSGTSYDTRVEMDVWYVENASTRVDLRILARTAASFLTGRLGGAR